MQEEEGRKGAWLLMNKLEPIFSKFRVPLAAATALVLAAGGVALNGSGDAASRVSTDRGRLGAGIEGGDQVVIPENGDAAAAGGDGDAAAARSSSGSSSRNLKSIGKKGGIEVFVDQDTGVPEANLFPADKNLIGITDNKIVLCGHAATSFGPAFNSAPEDLNVYWQDLNDRGGVHGRQVEVTWENDNYSPEAAVVAATACKEKGPFILLGGIGFEQIPEVRKYVEQQQMLYLHHIAREDLSKKFSWSYLPSVEKAGWFGGDWIGKRYPSLKDKTGVVYRDNSSWDPGFTTFVQRATQLGALIHSSHKLAVAKNQGVYQQEILALNNSGNRAKIVFVWENVVAATALIQQASDQGYRPKWVIFPFNLATDTLGDRALDPTIDGLATWSAYSPGDYSGPFASYADEIKRMEAAYQKYRNVPLTDIHWMTWLAWKQIHHLMDICQRDCNRNKIAGLLLTNTESVVHPECEFDFSINGHVGGTRATMFTSYAKSGGTVGWRHIPGDVCREAF